MRNVGMLDLQAESDLFRSDIRSAIERVLDHQRFIGGPEVEQLEGTMADVCGRKFAIAVSSGTDALLAAMMTMGIGRGDEVITTPFTFFATAGCIHRTGAKPVFVDIEPDTFNIDPSKLTAAMTERTRLIIPVHLFGQCADMERIGEVAGRQPGLSVLTDAAQAIGASRKGQPACSLGFATTLSFYPTKNLGGFGEGGMVLTDDDEFAQRCRMCRNHGETSRYHHEFVGGNFRLDTMKSAILLAKLVKLQEFNAARRRNAARYGELLADLPVQPPVIRPENESVYHQYSILCDDRDGLMAHLRECGVGCGIYYPVPLHLQECFKDLGYKAGDFPASEEAARRILALPIQPMLSDEDLQHVAGCIREYYTSK